MSIRQVGDTPGLFEIGASDPDRPTFVYYLTLDPLAIGPPTLQELFDRVDLRGWYVFTNVEILDGDQFAAAARSAGVFPVLTTWNANQLPRGVVWLPDPDNPATYTDALVFRKNSPSPNDPRVIAIPHTFALSGFGLAIGTTMNVRFDAASAALQLYTSDYGAVQIFYNGTSQTLGYPLAGWVIPIPLTAYVAGYVELGVGLDGGTMQQTFGCGFTYYYASDAEYESLAYPCFPPRLVGQQAQFLGFVIRVHPLHPLDARSTRFALDLSGGTNYSKNSLALQCTYYRSINGEELVLTPIAPSPEGGASGSPDVESVGAPGFAFCLGPAPGASVASPPETVYTLAPVGGFRLTATGEPGGKWSAQDGDEVRWMGGLFGQEFVRLTVGDAVEFVNGKPAFAPAFRSGASGDDDAEPLTGALTTSWVRFPVEGDATLRGYYSQPSSSVYYAIGGDDVYPSAVDSLLSSLSEPAEFPAVPYGGVFTAPSYPRSTRRRAATRTGATTSSPNAPPPFAEFESAVLSAARHRRLANPDRGPVFRTSRPVLSRRTAAARSLAAQPRAADGTGAPTAMTPQGFLVNLTPDGEWETVRMARSPDEAGEYLEFFGNAGSPSLVSPELSALLMQNQLVLVATNPAPLGGFGSRITLRGFNFDLSVGAGQSVLVFKYDTSISLKELAATPALWSSASTFVGDGAAVASAQGVILDAIQVAASGASAPGHPFEYFNSIVSDPAWTGLLAFNAAIDGNGMPPDLQMLLGGIQGQLRAHHFGVETSRVLQDSGGAMSMDRSSLFGVIHYDAGSAAPNPGDFAYAVETLTVVFSNSKVALLAASVGLTINRLFGRDVLLTSAAGSPDPTNTLVIHGQYQSQGEVGTIVFSSDAAFIYDFPVPVNSTRVTDRVEITHASLAPISSTAIGSPAGGTHVLAGFAMSGELWFTQSPFPGADGLDLFSYGNPSSGGMAFASLTVHIDFDLDSQGKLAPGMTVSLQPSLLTFSPAASAIRSGSLLESLPLQFSRFWYAPAGLTATQLGAVPVNCLQLEGGGSGVTSPSESGPYPFVSTSPHYALEFDMPLGSLGSLSEVTVGIVAKLLLAWGPSSVVPDNDAAAVLVQLPSVFGGAAGFSLQGILRTTFGDANLLLVDVDGPTYAILFNNIKFSLLGFSFPPGVMIDFVIFAGQPGGGRAVNDSNIAWYLAAQAPAAKSLTE